MFQGFGGFQGLRAHYDRCFRGFYKGAIRVATGVTVKDTIRLTLSY